MKVHSSELEFNKQVRSYTGTLNIGDNVPMSLTMVTPGGSHEDYTLMFSTSAYSMFQEVARKRNLKTMKISYK